MLSLGGCAAEWGLLAVVVRLPEPSAFFHTCVSYYRCPPMAGRLPSEAA